MSLGGMKKCWVLECVSMCEVHTEKWAGSLAYIKYPNVYVDTELLAEPFGTVCKHIKQIMGF